MHLKISFLKTETDQEQKYVIGHYMRAYIFFFYLDLIGWNLFNSLYFLTFAFGIYLYIYIFFNICFWFLDADHINVSCLSFVAETQMSPCYKPIILMSM